MKRRTTYIVVGFFASVALLAFTGCSEDNDGVHHMMVDHQEHTATEADSHDNYATSSDQQGAENHSGHASHENHSGEVDRHAATQETKPPDARAIRVVATDFAFEPANITAKPGEKLHIKLVNEGDAVHMWQIGDRMETHVHTNAGETSSKTVTAPVEPGVYDIVCTTPGHKDLGMVGSLTVRAEHSTHGDSPDTDHAH